MKPLKLILLACCIAFPAACARADEPPPFDATRYMRVAEVKEGMTGYGLSVFKGTQIARFDVKVLSVLHNFNPKYDVVLISCQGQDLEHTGTIAGMSGSPIYLKDEAGRFRMIGAFAYGWPMMKDPIGGVQPIEYMLRLPDSVHPAPATSGAGEATRPATARLRWSLFDVGPLLQRPASGAGRRTIEHLSLDGTAPRLEPLATPLMTVGMSQRLLDQFAPALAAHGLVAVQGGGGPAGGGNAEGGKAAPAGMEPGSVLVIPVLTGDAEMTAIGTCTEVVGDRVYGFGHPFNNEGPIDLPMGTGEINAVIANLNTSFKLGSLTQTTGTLLTDQSVGVAGRIGVTAPTIPMDIHIVYPDAVGQNTSYHFNLTRHAKLTALVASNAMGAALTGVRDLPLYHTLDYDLELQFTNGQSVRLVNTDVNISAQDLFNEIGLPISAAADNPFENVPLSKITGTVKITPEAREARIVSVSVPRSKYQPGETVRIFVTYRPFRAAEAIMSVDFELPRDLPNGTYELGVSDAATYIQLEQQLRPFRFTAQSLPEIFAVLHDALSIRHNAMYVQLQRQADGVAIGRTAMPHLPSSRRQILLDAGLSDTIPFVSSTLKIVPTEMVMTGAATFSIAIDRQAKVESAPHPPVKKVEPKPEGHAE